MRAALALARRGLGSVWPNPAVGCILFANGEIVGRGWTQPGGRPHAEAEALRRAGARSRGATAYITLEPCAHTGLTPPCAEALVAAGIGGAVVAVADPDPRVDGRGIARLRAAGIAVTMPLLADEAADLNLGFFRRIRDGRPLITLKSAASLDGRIATAEGESRWITGDAARALAHALRADHDAVLVGSGTAIADDPMLTCRLPGRESVSPLRIVADTRLRIPPDSRLAAGAERWPTWVLTSTAADPDRRRRLVDRGIRVIDVDAEAGGRLRPEAIVLTLGGLGLTRVLIEGGGMLAASFLAADLVDRIVWMQAPRIIGGDGRAAVAGFGLARLDAAPSFVCSDIRSAGHDLIASYRRRT